MPLSFQISQRDAASRARIGRVTTPHGSFDTPAFMPVGTRGSVKGITPWLVRQTGAQIILGNTYHLMLRPGSDLVQRMGGLQRFTGWPHPMLTDSGGFQAFSLSDSLRLTDDAVMFQSIVDGSTINFTPERAMQVQNELGADIIMALDDCPPSIDPSSTSHARECMEEWKRRIAAGENVGRTPDWAKKGYDHARRLDEANERTIRWLERCKAAHARASDQALFGIVQGGTDLDCRTRSASQVTSIDLPGYAIGGVAVGEGTEEIRTVVEHTAPLLPESKPRYLMGVGYERDIVAAVRAGIDMFDCVLPTRNGRNASAFTPRGTLKLRNARYAEDPSPIDPDCDCPACKPALAGWPLPAESGFSRAFIRHLFMADEMLGPILVSLHNLRHFQRLMLDIRAAIRDDAWLALANRWPVVGDSLRGLPRPNTD